MVLPDTSVWVSFFRGGRGGDAERLAELVAAGEAAICGPVFAELLAGADEEQRAHLLDTVFELPWAELDRRGWLQVGDVARKLNRAGRKVPLTDLAIAVASVRAGHALWTLDADFERIRPALPELTLYEPG